MKVLIFILVFFIVGSLLIIENNNLAMHKYEDSKLFFNLLLKWVDNLYLNLQSLTGNIIKMDWFLQD